MLDEILSEVKAEVERAEGLYGKFCSGHEGYAVILEELDELWDLIKENKGTKCTEAMRKEAVQVAAMATRFIDNLS